MNRFTPSRSRSRAALQATPVAAAVAVLLCSAGTVQAQQAAPAAAAPDQVITVTGIRRGIESAISVKKGSDAIVEAISAEDIGKLPDASVAESLSRLPGVTVQRSQVTGRARDISVRGMAPSFNGGLLNGREVASTSDGRNVDYDQYPSELMSQLIVHKTPTASLLGQGLASTIDQQTVRPLSFGKRTIAASYRYEYNDKADDGPGYTTGSGNRVSLSYVDQFADRTVGVALGISRYEAKGGVRPSAEWGGSVDYDIGNNRFAGWDGAGCADAGAQCVKAPAGFKFLPEKQDSERLGAMAVLQWKPNKDFETVFDVFYSKGDFSRQRRGIEGPVGALSTGGNDSGGSLLPGYTLSTDGRTLTSGTFTNFKGVVDAHNNDVHDELNAYGLNLKYKLGGWTYIGDVSTSKVTKREPRIETTIGLPVGTSVLPTQDTISFSGFNGTNAISGTTYTTGINYADPNIVRLTNPQGWGGSSGQDGYFAEPTTTDKVNGLRFAARRTLDAGLLTEIEAGVNLGKRTKERVAREGALLLPGSTSPAAGANAPIPGAGSGIAYGIPVATWDPSGSVGTVYRLDAWTQADILAKSWGVEEKTTTAWLQGNLDGELFGLPLRGNAGVQFANTKQTSSGHSIGNCSGNTCNSVYYSRGRSYNDALPAMNLSLEVGGDAYVRLGLGRQLSRPNMDDLRGTVSATVDNTQGTVTATGGNPELKPFKADALDVSFEKYFGTKGVISIAGFYKDLKSYIVRGSTANVDLTPYLVAGQLPPGFPTVRGTFNQPVNGEGGNVTGIEASVNIPLDIAASALKGFGVIVNYAYTDSNVDLPTSGFSTNSISRSTMPLPGLSKHTSGLRFYYEAHGWQVGLAYRSRSEYVGSIQDFQDKIQLVWVKPEKQVDLQMSYEFGGGFLKGLSLMAQANNLTNQEMVRYNEVTGETTETKKFGTQYLVGLSYKF